MPRIEVVDYRELQNSAKSIREGGNALMNLMRQAFTKVGEMSSAWYGKRYNMVVDEFNKNIPLINNISQLTMADFPNALDAIAVNYARVDMEELSPNQSDAVTKISEIAHNQAIGLRFVTDDVINVNDAIKECFNDANEQLENISGICNSLPWTSEAQEAFVATFTNLKNQIQQSFNDILTAFNANVDAAKTEMEQAENANKMA